MNKYEIAFNELVVDTEQYSQFVDCVLPDLGEDEVYFVSLSARNKYLTAEEREYYALGRAEMYERQIARSKEGYHRAMARMGASVRTTRNGTPIPEHARVVYANINPSSATKAVMMFQKQINEIVQNAMVAGVNGKQANIDGFRYANRTLMNCYQKAKGTRYWLDIDFDVDDDEMVIDVRADLFRFGIESVTIETYGGYHILINRRDLKGSGHHLHQVVKEMNDIAAKNGGEVCFNSNAMCPVPGTLQAGKLVKIWA